MEPTQLHRAPAVAQLRKNGGFTPQHFFRSYKSDAGFTLVEMLVVLGIITVIMAIVITSQSSFNKSLILANTAYDVGLALRSAETFGIGSRANAGASNIGYGLHFEVNSTNKIVLFGDTVGVGCHSGSFSGAPDEQTGDCIYQASSPADSTVNTYMLGNGIKIVNLCFFKSAGGLSNRWYCYAPATNASLLSGFSTLDIVFSRPNPAPNIIAYNGFNQIGSSACITLASPQGGTSKYVFIGSTGVISANASTLCPN